MKFKLFMFIAIIVMALTSCNKAEKELPYVEEEIFDTVSVSNPLSDNRVLLEYIWDKRWCSVDPTVTLYLVPKGSVINYDVYTTTYKDGHVKKSRMISKINKNDFLVVNSDISFFHPEEKELDNLFTWNREKLIKKGIYKIKNFPMLMTAKEADEFIEFAPLNVWWVGGELPYLIPNLEEWRHQRSCNIKDDDLVFFKQNGAMAWAGRRDPLTIEELFRYHEPKSGAPIVYIKKNGKLVALIGQEGKLWGTR